MGNRIGRQTSLTWNLAVITGIREIGLEGAGEPIDITAGDDSGIKTLIANVVAEESVTVNVSGVTKDEHLKDDWFGATRSQTLLLTYPDTSTLTGTFQMTSYSEGDPYNDAATFEATFVSNGAVTYTPA